MLARLHSDPWREMDRWRRDVERVFNALEETDNTAATATWTPAVDIKEQTDAYVLHADLPGVDPKDIDVHMEDGVLTIKGQREWDNKEQREDYSRIERVRGNFYRRFTLPDTADSENITANSKDGVLQVRIPKHEKVQPRRIAVQH